MTVTTTIGSDTASAIVSASAATHVGMVRAVNEDSHLVSGPVFLVADGMGGHDAGDKASQTVRDTFGGLFGDGSPTTTAEVLEAIRVANVAVRSLTGDGGFGRAVSGTTLTGLALVTAGLAGRLHWMAFNIGDSRIYSWDGRALVQLTVDHSAVQELVEAGLITAPEAEVHPARNVITRAIGGSDHVEADVWLLPASGIQRFLLCSDGLTREINDEGIAAILAETPPEDAANALVAAAVSAGGRDNVTVVVVESESTRDEDSPESLEDTRPRN